MPELPEVECLTRAVSRSLQGAKLTKAKFFRKDLRDPIPVGEFRKALEGQFIDRFWRRSKYMVWQSGDQCGVFHLGMSGNMRLLEDAKPVYPHTHAIFMFEKEKGVPQFLHFIDPRRFGRISCIPLAELESHPYFSKLGPEPLVARKLGEYLFERSRNKKQAVKTFLMDARVLVGVGNIYASESLFRAGISPTRPAGTVKRNEFELLAIHIKATLREAIKAGGTTFRDFKSSDGEPGYFFLKLNVYDREGEPCRQCGDAILNIRQTGRSTYYCPNCQK